MAACVCHEFGTCPDGLVWQLFLLIFGAVCHAARHLWSQDACASEHA
eukprot:CAMPEP_0204159800 /NCGR_PEP_ID=MMETSP0361-20130328/33326_1 /ASSEMBLY_ACC=CAM_ASM_000343 /TAXON_ID=268821 /ORGANISM="Scrippsiella Hangoei, Strain SHTV-5" /LENGTH=46 /DNA_ID= /DNA_START= /DNA_END= /DNA_ORIENTATION=